MNSIDEFYSPDMYLSSKTFISENITEYDIKSAGVSILRRRNAITQEHFDKLMALPKEHRVVEVGMLERKYPELKKELKEGFMEARKEFITSNNLQESEIIEIRKDAIFTTKKVKITRFHTIEWIPKMEASMYMRFPNSVSLFYCNDGTFSCKGINIEKISKIHSEGILTLISIYCNSFNYPSIFTRWEDIIRDYSLLYYHDEFYVEFNSKSQLVKVNDKPSSLYNMRNVMGPLTYWLYLTRKGRWVKK
jgi:hypothetical protein